MKRCSRFAVVLALTAATALAETVNDIANYPPR